MRKSGFKAAVVVILAGTLLQIGGGCLGVVLQRAVIAVIADQIAGQLPDLGGIIGGDGTTNAG